ncbi:MULTISPECIES: ArsR/SmtB family transcription factor [Bacillaceae]|jgi:ArsR family transcriptional regulator|uniref:ArsR/SmtB family transcription factor n=1 Tax=Bacillaceae TaxID=186817 RepID=UPI00101C3EF5|nr:metalloregulator ArsR/SmtB family transcription factor [Ectobacillus funiculus]
MLDFTINQPNLNIVAEQLKVIAHPVRLQILQILMERGPQNVTSLYEGLGLPQSTLSQHLAKMKSARIVLGNRKGLEIYYEVLDSRMKQIVSLINEQV